MTCRVLPIISNDRNMKRLFEISFLCSLVVFSCFLPVGASLRDKIEDKIKETILSTLSLSQEKVGFSFRNLDQLDYAEESEVKIFLLSQREPKGIVPIRVEVYDRKGLLKVSTFTIEVKIYDDVVVVSKSLDRNEEITPDKLTVERRDVTCFVDGYFKSKEEIESKRAKKTIPKGRIVGADCLEDIPLVNRGDKVKIVAETGGIRIWAFGTCDQDGRLGEKIKVRNSDSKKIITARVINNQIVCIDLGENL